MMRIVNNEKGAYLCWSVIIALPRTRTAAFTSAPKTDGMDPVKMLFVKSNISMRDNEPISGGMLPVNKLLDTSKTS
eukprot:8683895-Ditylum_brightwellii.AAC.1